MFLVIRESAPSITSFDGHAERSIAEMVLDEPHRLKAERVGQYDFVDRLFVGRLLGLALAVRVRFGPWLDLRLQLIEKVELHRSS